ncbi:hypothetical protein [Nocardia callitridis]
MSKRPPRAALPPESLAHGTSLDDRAEPDRLPSDTSPLSVSSAPGPAAR